MDVDALSISYLAVDSYGKDEREIKRMKATYSNSPLPQNPLTNITRQLHIHYINFYWFDTIH